MTTPTSAGILVYRRRDRSITDTSVEVLLGHMGGPYWSHRDAGAWTIPKGEYRAGPTDDADAAALAAARREFTEELGVAPPPGPMLDLGSVAQSRKMVRVWAIEGDLDPSSVVSNTFEIEWPPRSGRRVAFPELDRVAWFDLPTARRKLVAAQVSFLDRLTDSLGV